MTAVPLSEAKIILEKHQKYWTSFKLSAAFIGILRCVFFLPLQTFMCFWRTVTIVIFTTDQFVCYFMINRFMFSLENVRK